MAETEADVDVVEDNTDSVGTSSNAAI